MRILSVFLPSIFRRRAHRLPGITRLGRVGLVSVFLALSGAAQGPAGSLLVIETANHAGYVRDVADYSLLATKPGPTTAVAKTFVETILIGDIVSVNGMRVKGTVFEILNTLSLRPDAAPGQAIADITRGGLVEWYFEILDEDSRQIGTIRVSGTNGGAAPPGQTRQIQTGNYVVVGGTGAFLGARGYMGSTAGASRASLRGASMAEDPASGRLLGGGSLRQGVYIIPMFRPEVLTTPNGPAVVHASDFSLVTAAKPARAGEVLTLFAPGLGPTRPGVEPGQPFPAGSPQVANSPIDVTVNGSPADVLYAGGFPGSTDGYQVNFRLPSQLSPGSASLSVSAAWIAGPYLFSVKVQVIGRMGMELRCVGERLI